MAPMLGRYNLCSKITSAIGIMDDSTDNVMKNQKMPKETSREFGVRSSELGVGEL